MVNTIKSECLEKYILGKSFQISRDGGIAGDFDLFIFCCGWESRCTEIINHDQEELQFNSAAIISFKMGDDLGYDNDYMKLLASFSTRKTNKLILLEHEPTELDAITHDIDKMIAGLADELGRPIYIGFDITCCPRFVFLYILGYCLRTGIAKDISFFYSEGIYESGSKEYVHTRGSWKIIEIPGLEAREYILNKKLFVVSAGWEGSRYRSVVAKYEPDRLGILLPDPGFTSDYTYTSREECKPLIEEYNLGLDAIVSAPAGDAIAAWQVLKAPALNIDDHHIAYLTFGPKPHSLAMGIRGFLYDEISVIYRIPEEYTKIEVKPNGIFWRYDIKNLLFI